jgi:hypothetical protein
MTMNFMLRSLFARRLLHRSHRLHLFRRHVALMWVAIDQRWPNGSVDLAVAVAPEHVGHRHDGLAPAATAWAKMASASFTYRCM